MGKDIGVLTNSTQRVGKISDLPLELMLAWANQLLAAESAPPEPGLTRLLAPADGVSEDLWKAICGALRLRGNGLPGKSALGVLLAELRGAPLPEPMLTELAERASVWQRTPLEARSTLPWAPAQVERYPGLNQDAILAWADAHFAASGHWPASRSGPVRAAPFAITWRYIDSWIGKLTRTAAQPASLAGLIMSRRRRPRVSSEQVLVWADEHYAATGHWPTPASGPVLGTPWLTWHRIDDLLGSCDTSSPRRLTINRLLALHRGQPGRRSSNQEPLAIATILAWAEAHHSATGRQPNRRSGPVRDAPRFIKWSTVDGALRWGRLGLPASGSLSRLLREHQRPRWTPLSVAAILTWADAHHAATEKWPTSDSGMVRDAPFPISWLTVDRALQLGRRGLPAGLSLCKLLAAHGRSNRRRCRRLLTVDVILAWADAHQAATGRWPSHFSGLVRAAPGRETWTAINLALQRGYRGLPGGSSLSRLLVERRGKARPCPIRVEQILAWADAHRAATGSWPTPRSGPVSDAPSSLTWSTVESALWGGARGLPGRLTIRKVLVQHGRIPR